MCEEGTIKGLQDENAEQKQRIEFLERLVKDLESRLARYENPHTPPSLKRGRNRGKKQNEGSYRKPGQKEGHKGVTRPYVEPDETVEVIANQCPDCGAMLGDPVSTESKIIEEIPEPQPIKVTEFLVAHYVCPCCQKEVVATDPNCPKEGKFGNNIISHVAMLKYKDRLPHRKIKETLQRIHGLKTCTATILDLTRRAVDAVLSQYEEILNRIRSAPIVYIDETSIRVQGSLYWIWGFTTPFETFYVIRKSRGINVLMEVLTRKFNGIIVCDGWKSYVKFSKRLQRCWAHLLRESKALAEKIEEAVPLHEALKKLYSELNVALEDDPPPETRTELWNNAKATLQRWISGEYVNEKLRKFIGKISNGFEYWFTFVINPGVEPTNNRAERALREQVVLRKILGTLRNDKGTSIHERITTVLVTWEQQGLNCYQMMKACLAS
jgi:transposase